MSTKAAQASAQRFQPPASSALEIEAGLTEAERARREVTDTYPTDRIVTALARAAGDWLDPREPLRTLAIDEVALITGFHPSMVATGFDFIFSAVNVESLERLVRAESITGALGPRAVFYSLAGNVPGQGVPAIACSLLARSIAIVRDSARQPVLTAAFRETIRRYDPALAAMVLPVSWSHRTNGSDVERVVIAAAERIDLYGTDRTVDVLAARYRAIKPVGCAAHGARVSAGLVTEDADSRQAAHDFAVDIAMYEGRGCLTPHTIVVEGSVARATEFADALAGALAALETLWPRTRGSMEEERERRRFIDDAELRSIRSAHAPDRAERCVVGPASAWCVEQTSAAAVVRGPGLRCVRVAAVPDRTAAITVLAAAATPLAGVGVAARSAAAHAHSFEKSSLTAALQAAGAMLVCDAGRMQAPPIDWQQDGRQRLDNLLRGSR